MMRQIAGAFAEYEKARLVAKLRGARERIRKAQGKCEGRKPRIEALAERLKRAGIDDETRLAIVEQGRRALAESIAMAKRLHRASPKTGKRMSLRKISDELAAAGHLNERGKPFNPWSVQNMLNGPQRQIRRPTS